MAEKDWIYMPHAGHFICAYRCQFKMNTYVNGYIVSTVGEMMADRDPSVHDNVGYNRKYETMVFLAIESGEPCCKYVMACPTEVDFDGYNDAKSAMDGHRLMCLKYDVKNTGVSDDSK